MWKKYCALVLANHRGKFVGAIIGLVIAVLVITIGFFKTVFIAICLIMGIIVGKRIDDNESIKELVGNLFREK